MTDPIFLSKSAFAAHIGKAPSYITWLKDNNRLVLSDDGKRVNVDATVSLIRDTADPSKAAVAARHQADRVQRDVTSQLSPLVESTPNMAAPQPAIGPAGKQPDFQKARAHREYYLAQLAEAEFHKVQGSQVELEAVKTGAFNAGRLLRDQLLGMPPQLAPELAAMTDPWEIERRLTAAIRASLEDAERMSSADLVHALNNKS
ncbi:terminase small subunit [Pseudomonas sp. FSL R10-0056]|uniref:terminase small subunit n=1 Tax=unclassified Pseudomonas TaxID=196821 RepID=UPI00135F21E3|nr:terminase small subunit [Pseudomonas sp. FSL R10-0056]MQT70868.1 terminase small subunit [Pseudomonas sp. FSL R10-0071]MQU50517.1 terminase small subunit [Pseudomonas sp. FSL A6-1183]